jgi:hypothetical protein
MRIEVRSTSPGGRVFAVIMGLLATIIASGAWIWAWNTLTTGIVTLSIGRGRSRGKVSLDGALAYMQGLGMAAFGTWAGLLAVGFLLAALSRSDTNGRRALRLILASWYFLGAAAVLAVPPVIIDVWK